MMHLDAWLERLADAGGEPRERLARRARDARPGRGDRASRRSPARRPRSRRGILAEPMADARGALAEPHGARRLGRSACRRCRRRATPADGRTAHSARRSVAAGASSRWSAGSRHGRDVVSLRGEPTSLGRTRGPGGPARRPRPGDPGGLDRRPRASSHESTVDGGAIRVELLPTFVGCPALEVIRDAVARAAGASSAGRSSVEVRFADAVDVRSDHAGRPRDAPALRASRRRRVRGHRAAPCRCSADAPVARARTAARGRPAREHFRADPVPLDPPLRRLPATVRAVQGDLTPMTPGRIDRLSR